MSDKSNKPLKDETERILNLEEAMDMTVEEAVKTQEEIQAGITKNDGLLDRYIKQHREEIEAGKFETQQLRAAELAAATAVAEKRAQEEEALAQEKAAQLAASEEVFNDYDSEIDEEAEFEAEKSEKRRRIFGGLLALLALLGIAGTAYSQKEAISNLFGGGQSDTKQVATETDSKNDPSTTSQPNPALAAFEELYGTFFTDEKQTALKNDSFGQLQALETALGVLEGTADYDTAKAKVDKLKAAIEATNAVNDQFDKPVLVDGEIDTTATAKVEADFAASSTGITSVDAALTAAANFGRSQQSSGTAASVVPAAQSANPAPAAQGTSTTPASVAPSTGQVVHLTNGISLDYNKRVVYGNDQVNLQRQLSRVPYNDDVIADAGNEAWVFAPNVLENIIATSNQRGYFAGNDFILEKVNIINGRGYYNMFKSDGTYLFSINAKTGYFVGNGSGYADALDF